MNYLKKLLGDNRGNAVIEAALVMPLFIYLSLLIIEASLIHYYQSAIDNALYETIRFSKVTKDARTSDALIDAVRDRIKENTYGLASSERLVVTTDLSVDFNTEFAEVAEQCIAISDPSRTSDCNYSTSNPLGCSSGYYLDDTDNDSKCDMPPPPLALGLPEEIVTVVALYKWTPLTPGVKYFFGNAGDSSKNRNYQNILQANTDGDHIIVNGMTYRNEE